MADIQSNININIDTSAALANLKNLQREISATQRELAKGTAANAANARELQRGLLGNINATGQFAASLSRVKSSAESFTNALEKNKLSMGEYFKYAGASSKTFGRLFTNEFNTIEKVARERVKTIATQYIKLGRTANGAIEAISVRPLVMDMDNLATKTAMAAQKQQIFNQLMKQGSTNLLNFGKNTQWAGRQLMVGFTIPLTMLGTQAAKTFMELEEQAIRFRRVYGESFTATSETEAMISQVRTLATEFTKYGVAVEKTMELAATAAASGKMGADLLAQVSQATRLAVLGGVEQAQALETTISVTNAFGVATEDLAGKIDFLNAVENQTVTSIEDLTVAIPKAGPVIQQLGGDVEDLAFFLTAMKEGGINASEGANALKSGLAALINPTATASKFLQGFGVNIKGIVDANRGDVKGLVVDFASALDTLDPLNRARAIEQLFGKFQFARISTLFKNVVDEGSQASRVLKLTNATTAELAILSQRELKRIEDSPMYKFKKAFEDLKVSLAPVGEAFLKAVTPFLTFGTSLLSKFNELSEGGKSFIVGLTVVLGAIGPIAIMAFGLLANGVAQIIKGFLAVRGVFSRAGDSAQTLGSQTNYMTNAQLEAAAAAASLDQAHSRLAQTFSVEKSALGQLTAAYEKAIVAQGRFTVTPNPTTIGKGKKPAKYAKGVSMVPGPRGAGDVVPAMLAPGEAIIPADKAKKYSGFIQGMIAGNIPGFEDGLAPEKLVRAHLQENLDINDPEIASQIEKQFPGFSAMSGAQRANITAQGGLTAELPASVNDRMKSTRGGVSADKFESIWSGIDDKMLASAISAGLDPNDSEARSALKTIEAQIGKRAGELARKAGTTVTDTVLSTATTEILNESSTKGGAAGKLSAQLKARSRKLSSVRSKYDQDTLREMLGSGKAQLKRGPKGYSITDTESGTKIGRLNKPTGGLTRNQVGDMFNAGEINANDPRLRPRDTSVELRGGHARYPLMANVTDPKILEKQGETDGKEYTKGIEKGSEDPYVASRDRKSPHVLVGPDAKDDARKRAQEFRKEQAKLSKSDKYAASLESNYGGAQVVTGQMRGERKQVEKLMSQDRYAARQQASAERAAKATEARRQKGIVSTYGTPDFTSQMRQERKRKEQASKQANVADAKQRKLDARSQAREQAVVAQQQRIVKEKEFATQAKQQKRSNLMSKLKPSRGAIMGGGMAASSLAMGASMIGGPVGDAANQVMGPVMAISGLMSVLQMLPGPIGIVVAAVGGLAAIFIHLQEQLNSTRKAAQETATAMSSGAESMQSLAEFAGTTTPSEVMSKLRADQATPYNIVTGKETFGGSYMQSEPGMELLKQAQGLKLSGNSASAAKDIGLQLSQAISSNIITKEQAFSIANNLGEAMNDYDFAIDVNSTMTELLGPDGQNLLKDPLAVKVRLIEAKAESIEGPGQAKSIMSEAKGSWGGIRSNVTEVAAAEIQYAQNYKDIVDMGKQNTDQLELEHTKRLEILQAAGDLAGIEKEKTSYFANKEKLLAANAEVIKAENAYLLGLEKSGNEALRASARQVVDNLEASLKAQFEGAEQKTKDLANKTIENIANNPSLTFASKATLVASMTVDNIGLFQQVQALFPADRNPQFWDKIARVSIELGSGSQEQLLRLLPGFSDAGKADKFTDYVINLKVKGDAEGAQDALDTMTTLGKIKDNQGKPINLDDFINDDGSVTKKFIKLNGQLKTMNTLFAKAKGKKLTYDVVFASTGFVLSKSEIEYFNSLPAEQQKIYTTTYLTVTESIDKNSEAGRARITAYRKTLGKQGLEMSDSEVIARIAETEANKRSTAPIATTPPPAGDDGGDDTNGGGGAQTDPLDAILARLKQVRDAGINAAGGIKELMRVVGSSGKTIISTFTGTDQAFTKANVSKGFMDFYDSLDEKAKATYAKISGRGKNAVVTLTDQGKAIDSAYKQLSIGDFQKSLVVTAQENKNRANAFNKLTASGLDSARALELVQDAELALAISTKSTDTQVKSFIKTMNELEKTKFPEDQFNTLYSQIREKMSADRDKINIDFDLSIKVPRAAVLSAEQEIANLQYSIDDVNAGLQQISWQEDEINKKYEKRFEALDKIAEINDAVANKQKNQLTLADALSRGDISAAAKLVQEQRAEEARQALTDQRTLLEANKQLEIDKLLSESGRTKIQLQGDLLVLEKKVFEIEEKRLEPANKLIKAATDLRDTALNSLDAQDLSWRVLQNSIDLAKTKLIDYTKQLELANALGLPSADGKKGTLAPKTTMDPGAKTLTAAQQATVSSLASQVSATTKEITALQKSPSKNAAAISVLEVKRDRLRERAAIAKTVSAFSNGGMVPKYFASGGFARGTDTVPAMLTPGEFVVKKYAVDNFGVDRLKAINNGTYEGGSMYNYSVSVNVKSDANPDAIARSVMTQIKQIDSQRIRGNRL